MNCVIEHIGYLLRRHDCVVVPAWGAFIAHRRPAFFDIRTGQMFPPAREISFNPAVAHDDGLLVSSVARRNDISFERATQLVSCEIESMKHQLRQDGEIAFGSIGRFIGQEDGTPIFESSARLVSEGSAFLAPISVRPIIEQAREEAILESIRNHGRRSRIRRIGLKAAKVAASLAVVATVAVFLLTPVISGRNDNLASMSSVPRSTQTAVVPGACEPEKVLYIQVAKEIKEEQPLADEQIENEPVEEMVADLPVQDGALSDASVAPRCERSDRYCLIVASLPSEELAEKFVRESGDNTLGILVQDGKYRVYAATGSTTEETLRQKDLPGISSRYPDAWVCRRK